jgi:predicted dienelactone hydrolase
MNTPDTVPGTGAASGGHTRRSVLAGTAATLGSMALARRSAAQDSPAAWVGYRDTQFEFAPPGGSQQRRRLLFWYPGARPDGPFDYDGQSGRALRNAESAPGRHPVLVFSHGFIGAADQSIFITETLARLGYVVVAIDHADARGNVTTDEALSFLQPQSWTDATHVGRRHDLVAMLDYLAMLEADPASFLHRKVDLQRIGALGHSLGGYAVLGLAGARTAWREPRIRAVAAMAPYVEPYLQPAGFGSIDVPVLLQGGGLDIGFSSSLPYFYPLLRAPKYFMVLRDGNHLGWTNLVAVGRDTISTVRGGNPRWIVHCAGAFFDQHLRGRDCTEVLERPNAALESFVFAGRAG